MIAKEKGLTRLQPRKPCISPDKRTVLGEAGNDPNVQAHYCAVGLRCQASEDYGGHYGNNRPSGAPRVSLGLLQVLQALEKRQTGVPEERRLLHVSRACAVIDYHVM